MLYPALLAVHIVSAIFWGGAGILSGFFLTPSALASGPAGGAVMGQMMQRKFSQWMAIGGLGTVLPGLYLYIVHAHSNTGWAWSPEGLVLGLGGLLGLGAFFIGLMVQKPVAERMMDLGMEMAQAGGPPKPEQLSEMTALQARLARAAKLTAWHMLAAAVCMGIHDLAAAL